MENYRKLEHIAHGRYGEVYSARNLATGELVTVKEFNSKGHKFGLREIEVFNSLPRTQYIFKLLGHHWKNNQTVLCIIYENRPWISLRRHLDHLRRNQNLLVAPNQNQQVPPTEMTDEEIQMTMYQLCVAVDKCHSAGVMHRALYPDNVLIEFDPIMVCLSDFRSGKFLPVLYGVLDGDGSENEDESGNFTPPSEIFKSYLHYTAPELLMGANTYSLAVDIWSLGTIFAEMVNGTAFFQRGRNERAQLRSIFGILGIPSATERRLVPGVNKFEWSSFEDLQMIPRRPLAAAVPRLGPEGVDLLAQMLEHVPQNRISARMALSHPYFHGLEFHDE